MQEMAEVTAANQPTTPPQVSSIGILPDGPLGEMNAPDQTVKMTAVNMTHFVFFPLRFLSPGGSV